MENKKDKISDKDEDSAIFDDGDNSNELKEIINNMNKADDILKEAKKALFNIKEEFSQKKLKRKKYTLMEKAAIIILIENNISKHFIENEYGISRKTLREWESNKDKIKIETKKKFVCKVEEESQIP